MARLQKGVNDLKTWCLNNGDFGKQLMQEWTGECDDGKHYEIDKVSFGSKKKFKWKCSEGHEWYATPLNRTRQRQCCPYCSGKRVSDMNSLRTWCLNNGDFGQQLLQEWTGDCEDGKHYEIDEVSFGSKKKFKWKCDKGHVWFVGVHTRRRFESCCPHCSRNRVCNKNNLKTWCLNNGDFGQQLMNEWTGICEDGLNYSIDEVARASSKKFKWKCSEGHEWFAVINSRAWQKQGCPYCSGRRVSEKNSLKTWCLANTDFGQYLISEWTGECDDGKHYEIDEVSFGSSKKFKWKCSKGHEFSLPVHARTGQKQCCSICNHKSTSYTEQFIYWSLKQLYPNAESRCRVLKSTQNPHGIEFDIGIPDIPLCIEYSPTVWHKEKQERDNYKKELCEKANVRLIQIVEDSYDELEHAISDNYICFKMDYNKQDETLVCIIDHILKSIGHSISEIDIELAKKNAFEYSRGKVEYEKSLEFNYPELAKEWHKTLNGNLEPSDITCGSNRNIYWQCTKCNYGFNGEWYKTINFRLNNMASCPCCGFNWSDGKNHSTCGSELAIHGINDLQSQYPELVKEWHPVLNGEYRPDTIRCCSNKKIFWQCQKCSYGIGGEWNREVSTRVSSKTGCPSCGYNWSDGKIHKTSGSTVVIQGKNDLQSQYPELAKEWHPTLNKDLKPDKMKCGSGTKIYWKCTKCNYGTNGEWYIATVYRTYSKSGCPRCGYNWYKAQQGLPQKYKGKYSYLNDQDST